MFGSFEFLGNPVGLVSDLGTGVLDFFQEPAKGLLKSPQVNTHIHLIINITYIPRVIRAILQGGQEGGSGHWQVGLITV